MTPSPPPPALRGLHLLKTILYILAGLVLVVGLITGISLLASTDRIVANAVMPLQIIGSEILNSLVAPLLTSFFIDMGVIVLILSLVLSALLYGTGRLIGHTVSLEARLARLEARDGQTT